MLPSVVNYMMKACNVSVMFANTYPSWTRSFSRLSRENVAILYGVESSLTASINGVVVTWVLAMDPPGVRFPLNALMLLFP
jgi:hypothetical protein